MRRSARPGLTGGANAVSEAVRSSGLVIPTPFNFRTTSRRQSSGRCGSGRQNHPDADKPPCYITSSPKRRQTSAGVTKLRSNTTTSKASPPKTRKWSQRSKAAYGPCSAKCRQAQLRPSIKRAHRHRNTSCRSRTGCAASTRPPCGLSRRFAAFSNAPKSELRGGGAVGLLTAPHREGSGYNDPNSATESA